MNSCSGDNSCTGDVVQHKYIVSCGYGRIDRLLSQFDDHDWQWVSECPVGHFASGASAESSPWGSVLSNIVVEEPSLLRKITRTKRLVICSDVQNSEIDFRSGSLGSLEIREELEPPPMLKAGDLGES